MIVFFFFFFGGLGGGFARLLFVLTRRRKSPAVVPRFGVSRALYTVLYVNFLTVNGRTSKVSR